MPGCAAIGCNNRSEKGYSMKCFPRDPHLRREWKERVGRANWEPSKNSFLCHDHFEPDQWAENENGKVKLKRDAMPSIFKETSTRKSPRKIPIGEQSSNLTYKNISELVEVSAVRVVDDESENDNYAFEYLDDCEYQMALASTGATLAYGKPLNQLTTINAVNTGQDSGTGLRKDYGLAYQIVSEKDVKRLEKENVIIVSDENNREIGKLVQSNENVIIVADENNKEIGQIVMDNNPLGQRNFTANLKRQNSYDEIEEKLKQICNGEDVTVSITRPRIKDVNRPVLDKVMVTRKEVPTAKTNDSTFGISKRKSEFDKEIPKNLKLIFGDESAVENRYPSDNDSLQTNRELESLLENDVAKNITKENEFVNGNVVSFDESLTEDVTRNFNNLKADIKRQKRTRENVMRSIETVLEEMSGTTTQNVKNDQLARSILRMSRSRIKGDEEKTNAYKRPTQIINDTIELDSSNKKSKFTIRVTGVADDVSKIFEGLETESGHTTLKMNKISSQIKLENNERDHLCSKYATDEGFTDVREQSIETLKSDEEFTSEFDGVDLAEGYIADDKRNRLSNEFGTKLQEKEFSNEENGRIQIKEIDHDEDNNQSMKFKYFSRSPNPLRELRQKINAQQEVIGKLTDQLIIYKGLEVKLASLNLRQEAMTKENQMLKDKLENNLVIPTSNCKRDVDIKERTISILSNRVNKLKEVNKKLMLQIAAESQNKKLSHNLKQKDDQIKELNWKLEKASKFLDRAQKNANTYKRKMVSMQTSMRRQKAVEEKRNHFQELLIDNAKHEFSESALLTAMDIKNSCGIKCYQKLLSYNFPLPSLRTLRRRFQRENVTEDDWGDDDQEAVINPTNRNDSRTIIEVLPQNSSIGETEIRGTVQDIFEEINDAEELNTSELGEHIFLQLKTSTKYTDT